MWLPAPWPSPGQRYAYEDQQPSLSAPSPRWGAAAHWSGGAAAWRLPVWPGAGLAEQWGMRPQLGGTQQPRLALVLPGDAADHVPHRDRAAVGVRREQRGTAGGRHDTSAGHVEPSQ